jgi:hypothetical protein
MKRLEALRLELDSRRRTVADLQGMHGLSNTWVLWMQHLILSTSAMCPISASQQSDLPT